MQQPVSIMASGSLSPLGVNSDEIVEAYRKQIPLFKKLNDGQLAGKIGEKAEKELLKLAGEDRLYARFDRSVLLALAATRHCFEQTSYSDEIGVNIGSSRGATGLFEHYHRDFLKDGSVSAISSPTTTLGNISSAVLQDLGSKGMAFSHSITCSTALQAVVNAVAWLKSGMAHEFLVGGSEAALTPFTFAQIKALKLQPHPESLHKSFPNRSLDFSKTRNSLILGEGAAVFHLKSGSHSDALAKICGVGYGSERLKHSVSLSPQAECLQTSMKRALTAADVNSVDAIVMHAPGTVKGDKAELAAIDAVFGNGRPLLTSNKYLIGHTYGASGALSLEMALLMMTRQTFLENPLFPYTEKEAGQLDHIMINAVGFGGNATSIILSK